MQFTFDSNLISDLHKDARGYRPTMGFRTEWDTSSDEDKQLIWDLLLKELDERIAEENDYHEASVKKFYEQVNLIISLGAEDSNAAVRWLVGSADIDTMDKGYICYCLGLPYSMEAVFEEAFAEVV